MPISYRINSAVRFIHTHITGGLTDAELLAHKDKLNADPLFGPGMSELADAREIGSLDVTPNGVQQFISHERRHSERFAGHRLAIVASADVVFGMARMYQMRTVADVGVFRTMREALDFLGFAELPS